LAMENTATPTALILSRQGIAKLPAGNDYEQAAAYYNICRSNGIQGSHIDYLICSVAHNNDFLIFTLDKDFEQYRKYIDIELVNDIGGRFPSTYPNTERC